MSDYLATVPMSSRLEHDDVRRMALNACLDLHRVDWLRCFVAADSSRMLCWYTAPDAESVRLVLRKHGAAGAAVLAVVAGGTVDDEPLEAPRDGLVVELEHGPGTNVAAALGDPQARVFAVPHGSIAFVPGVGEARLMARLRAAGIEPAAIWRSRELDPRPARLFRPRPEPRSGTAAHAARAEGRDGEARQRERASADFGPQHADEVLDAVIVGAGLSGIAMLERLVRMGLAARIYESGSDVGGVWHFNRYPGARVDSESYTYGFAFSAALLEEWDWKELFAPQAEIARYLGFVADRLNLRRYIRFDTSVTGARFDETTRRWHLETARGQRVTARYLIAAAGTLSAPQLPDYPGLDSFTGRSFHSARWPRERVDLAGRRVGVIGTGATGVQVIQTIAAEVGELTVFQRTPTYCIPQRNRTLSDEDRGAIRRDWGTILERCRSSYGGFIHNFAPVSGLAVSAQEREAKFEALWQQPGFAFWFGNFGDLMMNDEVNAHACEFLRRKIAGRVRDPKIARRLLPDHPFGCKRVPLENGYYEVYNRPNVRLVDLRETPIERITAAGIRTVQEEHALDVIIYATGFDAGTGALVRIGVRGATELTLEQKWREGPRTYLGMLVHGFPNFFMVNGPQNAAAFCNAGRCVEPNVEWIARCLEEMRARDATRIEPTAEAEDEWTCHVEDVAAASVLAKMKDSWLFGANTPGKARRVTIYAAGARAYREHCENVVRRGYPGVAMT